MTAAPRVRRWAITHTEGNGATFTDRAKAEKRVAERRRTSEAHGWADRYELVELVPVEVGRQANECMGHSFGELGSHPTALCCKVVA